MLSPPISYSKLFFNLSILIYFQVGLYTVHGTLKDSTEVAPNSGYFFLPVYSKGAYKIKVRILLGSERPSDVGSQDFELAFSSINYNHPKLHTRPMESSQDGVKNHY